jgi:ABC-2 type transport system ATP-binding protein
MGYKQTSFIPSALELVGLAQVGDKPVQSYSLGMKQRLGLARAIVTRPKLLILDEPINGLDPVAIKEMRRIFKFLQEEFGMTLFISSHILGEIEHVADTVGIIQNGKLIEEVTIEELRSSGASTIFHVSNAHQASKLLQEKFNLVNITVLDSTKLQINDPNLNQQLLTKTLILNGIDIIEVVNKRHSLEDYFIEKMEGGIIR